MKTGKLIPLIFFFVCITFMTLHSPGYGQSNTPTYEELTKTNVSLEMTGFGFYSGLRPSQQGNPNGKGTEIVPKQWSGSGFIVRNDGTIFTNYHVAKRALTGKAYFEDGSSFDIISIKAYDSLNDIAVLKLRAFNRTFPTVKLGDSDKVRVMDKVIAVGNTLGESLAVTEGMINQINITDRNVRCRIRHSATIAPGNSGGSLYKGNKVIGINVAGRFPYAIYYAIPINLAIPLLQYDKEYLFRDVFPTDLRLMLRKSQRLNANSGTVQGGTNNNPGAYGFRIRLYSLEDIIIYLKAQSGRDLAVRVLDSRGRLLGFGDLRNVDYEYLLLSNEYTQDVNVIVYNYDKTRANFALEIFKIKW